MYTATVTYLYSKILKSLEFNTQTDIMYTDFAKGFDNINYESY